MKKYFKLTLASLLCLTVLFSFTACFSTITNYTEWEYSDNDLTLTGGTEVYVPYEDEEFNNFWTPSDLSCMHYVNIVESEYNTYASIRGSLASGGILALEIYENDYMNAYVGSRLYVNEEGKAKLNELERSVTLSTSCYAFDYYNYKMGQLSPNLIGLISGLDEGKLVTKNHYDLTRLDEITISAIALDGFLTHDFGVFYFDRTEIYYRDYGKTGRQMQNAYEVYKLDNADREIISSFLDGYLNKSMEEFGVEWETGTLDENANENGKLISLIVLLCAVFILGILVPLLVVVFSLIITKRRKWHFKPTDYILQISSGVWLLSGIITFIILLF